MIEISILTLRNKVLFPGTMLRVSVGRPKSIKVIDDILKRKSSTSPVIGIFALKSNSEESLPGESNRTNGTTNENEFYEVGCLAKVVAIHRAKSSEPFSYTILLHGVQRIKRMNIVQLEPYITITAEALSDISVNDSIRVYSI